MKIKTKGAQLFNVPMNEEGKQFIKLARKFRNADYNIKTRGRAKDRKAAYAKDPTLYSSAFNRQLSVPARVADWGALYVYPSKKRRDALAARQAEWERQRQERIARAEQQRMEAIAKQNQDRLEFEAAVRAYRKLQTEKPSN